MAAGLRRADWFYPVIAIALLAGVIAGFWPQYYGRLLAGEPLDPLVGTWGIHLHSTVSLGWMLLFVVQTALVWRGRTDLHRFLGRFFVVYAALLVVLDTIAGIGTEVHRYRVQGNFDRAAAFLFLVVRDLVMFGGFLIAGIAYRRRPEIHKRLIFLATMSLAMVGIGRMFGRWLLPGDLWMFELAALSPILLAVAHDLYTTRRIHPVYLVGLPLFWLRLHYANYRLALTELWLPIGRALLRPFV